MIRDKGSLVWRSLQPKWNIPAVVFPCAGYFPHNDGRAVLRQGKTQRRTELLGLHKHVAQPGIFFGKPIIRGPW